MFFQRPATQPSPAMGRNTILKRKASPALIKNQDRRDHAVPTDWPQTYGFLAVVVACAGTVISALAVPILPLLLSRTPSRTK